jgi:serine phosphatase RsbU (regulator of sigma subunit)/type II secretory pathway pseudopilin PulG
VIEASKLEEQVELPSIDPGERTSAPGDDDASPTRDAVAHERWPYWAGVAILIVGLLATGILTWVSAAQYNNNEKRLLQLRVKEVAAVLAEAQPATDTPLASAAALVDATNGDVHKFARFATPYVGSGPGQFPSISLWRPGGGRPVATVGGPSLLSGSPSTAQSFIARAAGSSMLSIIGLHPPSLTRIGYAYPSATRRFIVYAERPLPADRRSRLQSNSAFSDLDYAVYLGPSVTPGRLLVTSVSNPPLRGEQARTKVPFGNTALTLVVSPRGSLAGTLPQQLPWIIAIVGTILTLVATALTVRLVERRRSAEHLAGRLDRALIENQQLYAEQRTIAQTLQHALLPEELPVIAGAEASARFEPGERGVEIGGDWYDVIPLDDQRLLVVVGDVSGRGLRAAATMASLRFAIHAYAAQDDPPAAILTKLSRILSVTETGQIATVLCAVVDLGSRQVTVASAGHLPPLLISDGHGEYVEVETGVPIGAQSGAPYTSITVPASPSATLLAFTDGLVERRGEALDRGLERLRNAATADHQDLPELLGTLVAELRHEPSDDDTAIVGLRWTN